MDALACSPASIAEHVDAIERHHRFSGVCFNGAPWDLTHLDAFALRIDPGLGLELDVVVLFSCHCFTHSFARDPRPADEIPLADIYDDGRERRVLNEHRYRLSQVYLPQLIKALPVRHIQVTPDGQKNYMTFEVHRESEAIAGHYAIFFKPERDVRRARRVLLRVQSAYLLNALTKRQAKARKVRFHTLLRAAYEGRVIHG